jgi:hypothetical protein
MKALQVFLSHTSDMAQFPENRPFVQAAMDAVGRARMSPVDMRYFSARDGRPADYCQQQVLACDIYVAVIGFRYGSLVAAEGVSYTEWEFLTASTAGLPRLVFLLAEAACPPALAALADADLGLVEGFRKRLSGAGLLVREFTSSDSLELEVFHALSELANPLEGIPATWSELTATPEGRLLGGPGRGGPGGPSQIQQVPQVWNVPNRNADFTGRTTIIEQLREELVGEGRAAVLAQALYGLGGVGKTQVALEYAHRFKSDYDLIWWIPAEQSHAISLALADLAGQLGLQASDNAAETAAFALEQLRLGVGGRWLLIYDNAEEPADLAPYLPDGPGHVIITSRNHAWTHHARPVELDVFTRRESVTHLMQHVPDLGEDSAAKISSSVGDLPLAVEQAAAWLAETGIPASLYIDRLETQAADALELSKPFDYATPVAATWNLSVHRLRERSPAAVRLLQILAFCSPEPVSATLLYGDAMNAALLPLDPALHDRLALGHAIREASRLALIKVHQASASVQMHRLVQAVIRSPMTVEQQAETRHTVHRILVGAMPNQGETDDPANWSAYDIIWPHLEPSQAEGCDDDRTRELLIGWIRYQRVHGELESGSALADRLQRLWARDLGLDDRQTLRLQFELANVLRAQGRSSAARDMDTQVLRRQQAVLGANHADTLATANGLAADLRALGDFRRSLALDRKTYASFRKQFGADYPRTLSAANNLACSLRQAGRFSAARRLDEQTLGRRQRAYGPSHPYTLHSAANLGMDLRETGALRESVELLRTTHDRYDTVIGDETLGALRTAKSLAASLRKTGDLEDALRLTRETYGRYVKRYGPKNPDSLSCALNLAIDYSAHGDHSQARDMAEEIRASYQEALGIGHPFTLAACNNLAIYLRRTGDLGGALELAEQTVSTMRATLGRDHPFTLSCITNLTSCLGDASDLAQAEQLQRETIKAFQKVRGPGHPDTLICEADLAVTLQYAGNECAAGQIRTRVLEKLSCILGPQHPDAVLLQNWQYGNCEIEPSPI